MRFYWLIIGSLSTWRVTHLLFVEEGPWRVLATLRRRAGQGILADLFDCFYCLSLWVAAPIAWFIGEDGKECVLLWFAFSGGAILAERMTVRGHMEYPPTAYYKEDNDGVLRKESADTADDI